jgi:hypothetical protein
MQVVADDSVQHNTTRFCSPNYDILNGDIQPSIDKKNYCSRTTLQDQVQVEREIETKIKEIEPGVIVCAAHSLIYLYEKT